MLDYFVFSSRAKDDPSQPQALFSRRPYRLAMRYKILVFAPCGSWNWMLLSTANFSGSGLNCQTDPYSFSGTKPMDAMV
jgi:hypothetical protein